MDTITLDSPWLIVSDRPRILKDGRSVAVFLGIQSGEGFVPDLPLFNLTCRVGDHPEGSTVSAETLERLGYSAPATVDSIIDVVAAAIGTAHIGAPWKPSNYPQAEFTRQARAMARAALVALGHLPKEGAR